MQDVAAGRERPALRLDDDHRDRLSSRQASSAAVSALTMRWVSALSASGRVSVTTPAMPDQLEPDLVAASEIHPTHSLPAAQQC